MFKFLQKLFGIQADDSENMLANMDKLPPPSRRAMKKRERKAAEQIEAMKKRGVYLNVPFRKFDDQLPAEPVKESNVTKIRKTA
jgi:hypothetical protein